MDTIVIFNRLSINTVFIDLCCIDVESQTVSLVANANTCIHPVAV